MSSIIITKVTILTIATVSAASTVRSDIIPLTHGVHGAITTHSIMIHFIMTRSITTTGIRRVGVGASAGVGALLTGAVPGTGEAIGARRMPGVTRVGEAAIILRTRFTMTTEM